MIKRFLIAGFFVSVIVGLCAGQDQRDSLWGVWADQNRADTSRIEALCEYAKIYAKTNSDSAIYFAQKAYDYAESKKLIKSMSLAKMQIGTALHRKGDFEDSFIQYEEAILYARQAGDSNLVASSLYSIGTNYYTTGDYDKARDFYERSILVFKDVDNKEGMSDVLNNLGIINIIEKNYDEATKNLERSIQLGQESGNLEAQSSPLTNLAILKTRQGDYGGAMDLYMKGLAIDEQLGDEYSMAFKYSNLANMYYNLKDTTKFFENMNMSLEIRRRVGDKNGITKCLSSLGVVYGENDQHEKALAYFNECLTLAREIGNKRTIAHTLINIGLIDLSEGRADDVLNKLHRGLRIYEELNDQYSICQARQALGIYYRDTGDKQQAIKYYTQALALAKETDVNLTREIAEELYAVYESQGKSKLAFETYKVFIAARDSINNEANQREIIRQEYKYEYDKKAIADSISFAGQSEIQAAKLRQTRTRQTGLLMLLVLVAGFTVLLFNRFRLIRTQKRTIEVQNKDLLEARQKADQANRAKSDFLANMSHEIRTPMNAVLGFAELLENKVEGDQQKSYLQSIRTSGKSLLTLINDILDLSKIEAGKLKLEYSFFNVYAVLEEMRSIFSLKAREKGLSFIVDVEQSTPLNIRSDDIRFRQILINLINNAIKFTHEGYVKIGLTVEELEPQHDTPMINLSVHIKDTGIGISGDFQKKLFNSFTQESGIITKKFGGTGLGLAISRNLARLMDGDLRVESVEGEGSTFTLELRNLETIEKVDNPETKELSDIKAIKFEPATILLVDDIENNRNYVKGILEEFDFDLVEAKNGVEALEVLKEKKVDLILSDLRMPYMDGYELIKRIKSDETLRNIPIIAASASVIGYSVEKAKKHGFDDFISKPFRIYDLISCFARFMPSNIDLAHKAEAEQSTIERIDLAPERRAAFLLEAEELQTMNKRLKKHQAMSDVEFFSKKVMEAGETYGIESLVDYGNALNTAIDGFDIESILSLINRFDEYINTIKAALDT